MHQTTSKLQLKPFSIENTVALLTALMLVGTFVSTVLISLTEILLFLMWIWLMFALYPKTLKYKEPLVLSSIILLLMILGSAFYSDNQNNQELIHEIIKYRELLLFIILLPLLKYSKFNSLIYKLFIFLTIYVVIHSFLQKSGIVAAQVGSSQPYTSTTGRIAGAIILAFSCFAFLEESLHEKKNKLKQNMWIVFFILSSAALLLFFNGRTGIIIYLTLSLVYSYRFFGVKSIIITSFAIPLLLIFLYHIPSSVQQRATYTINQISTLKKTQPDFSQARLDRTDLYTKTSYLSTENSLLIGSGLASYKPIFQEHHDHKLHKKNGYLSSNPHQQFLLTFFEQGLIGLIALLAFFAACFYQARNLPEKERWLLYSLSITFIVGCLFNSLLMDNREAHFFVVLYSSIFWMGMNKKETTEPPK